MDVIHFLGKYSQITRCLLDCPLSTQLHLNSYPTPVPKLNYRVDFQSSLVTVVEDRPIKNTCVDTQVTHTQRLEKESKSFEIIDQTVRRTAQQLCSQRRINEMPLGFHTFANIRP